MSHPRCRTRVACAVLLVALALACRVPAARADFTFTDVTTPTLADTVVTIDPIESDSTKQAMKPAGAKLFDWIASWKV